jgi:tripartite ATP-independent transporter DctP family solute receptor
MMAGGVALGAFALDACGGTSKGGSITSNGSTGKKLTLKLSQAQTADSPEGRAAIAVAKRINHLTDGEVGMHVFPTYTLAPSDQVAIQQLATGALDAAVVGAWTNMLPAGQPFDLPYAFSSLDQIREAFAGEPGKTVKGTAPDVGVQLMNWWVITWRNIYGDKTIKTPDDLKGVKIRTQGTKSLNAFFTAVGAQPQSVDSAEVYLAMQTHQVDLIESSYQYAMQQKHYEVAKKASSDQHGISSLALVVSTKTWKKLDSDQQKAVQQAFDESIKTHDADSTKSLAGVEDFLKGKGMTFADDLDLAPFKQIAQGLYPQLVTDATQKQVLQQLQDMGAAGGGV